MGTDWDKKKIKKYKDFFFELVDLMQEKVPYADILLVKADATVVQKDKNTTDIDTNRELGVKLRVFNGESFFEYNSSDVSFDFLKERALELREVKVKLRKKWKFGKLIDKDFEAKGKIDPLKISLKKKVGVCEKRFTKVFNYDKKIVNVKVFYKDTSTLKIFVSKDKKLSQKLVRCNYYFFPFLKCPSGEIRTHFMSNFARGFEVTELSVKKVNDFCEFCMKIIGAEKIQPGRHDCILGGKVTGLLAHESFGHGMEADTLYKERAKAKSLLGKRITNSKVSIIDYPDVKAHGFYFFDDEGELSKPTYLIKKGIVGRPMTDLYSSLKLGIKRTSNGRCQTYDHKNYARMSNTYFVNGKDNLKNMFKSIKKGIYLSVGGGGMEDPKGWGVQIQGCIGEEILDGKLTGKLFYEIALGGYLPDIFSNIKAVASNNNPFNSGFCGKGHKEWVNVAEGGPHLLIKNLVLS
jgi:TldD protein